MKLVLEISSFDDARQAMALLVRYLSLEQPVCVTPITALGLTARAEHALSEIEIFTVDVLLEKTERELLPHLGRKVLNEVKEVLLNRQQRLKSVA